MNPKQAMRDIVSEVESVSGYAVHIEDVLSLPVLATVKSASANVPFTLIRVRQGISNTREYAISFQCGFVLRQYQLPSCERWDVAASAQGRDELTQLVRRDFSNKIGQQALASFAENLLGGLVTQLRSVPIGLRIDQWIGRSFPILVDQQKASNERQLQDNSAVLSPEIKRMAPEQVYSASVTMNAAMAAYWAKVWGDKRFTVPYMATGLLDKAEALLSNLAETPPEPTSDRKLIDSWAAELGISGWHEFVRR